MSRGRQNTGVISRTADERAAARAYARIFEKSPDPTEVKLAAFAKYVRWQDLTRVLALFQLFRRVLGVKGSIVECGVHRGASLLAWANFSAILEPANLFRRIYGFDTFSGFPSVGVRDRSRWRDRSREDFRADAHGELKKLIAAYDRNRYLGHMPRVDLVKGDAQRTIPAFLRRHPHLVVALLFVDFDLYEPTRVALEHLVPRMPRGAVIVFDELDNPLWPGETLALLDTLGVRRLRIERIAFEPNLAFAVL